MVYRCSIGWKIIKLYKNINICILISGGENVFRVYGVTVRIGVGVLLIKGFES